MLDHLGFGRLAVLLLLGLIVFGPERLPELAGQAGRALRRAREVLTSMTAEVKESLGPEFGDLDIASMHPRKLLASLTAEEPPPPPAPVEDPAFAGLSLTRHLEGEPVAEPAPLDLSVAALTPDGALPDGALPDGAQTSPSAVGWPSSAPPSAAP